jgi:hypothetical protein
MLKIFLIDGSDYWWKVGEPTPNVLLKEVEIIEAEGKELKHICDVMGDVEFGRSTMRFYGDIARTILLNL